MRKSFVTMGLGMALSLGALGAARAQATQPPAPRQGAGQHQHGRAERGPGRRGFDNVLLKGITLSADQQKRVDALRTDERSRMKADREQFQKIVADARAARQRGDTATAKARLEEMRSHMKQLREQRITALRAILTAEQQKQFDANLSQLQSQAKDRAQAGERGFHGRRGGRGQWGNK